MKQLSLYSTQYIILLNEETLKIMNYKIDSKLYINYVIYKTTILYIVYP